MKKWYVIIGILVLLLIISISTCSEKSGEANRLQSELSTVKAELNELQSSYDDLHSEYAKLQAVVEVARGKPSPEEASSPTPEEVSPPAPEKTTQLASIGDTIPVPHKENLSVTLLWWEESHIAVHGEYSGGEYWTFTAKPGMKFIILAYEFHNSWVREQGTPYLFAGEILTAPKGYYFELWDPPLGIHSEEYKPRRATAEEIETLIGDSGGYEKLMPEQSVIGCIKFEIPEDATPVEADIIGLRPCLVKF